LAHWHATSNAAMPLVVVPVSQLPAIFSVPVTQSLPLAVPVDSLTGVPEVRVPVGQWH